ncbi:hypothetical protein NC652_040381 [Populus alba x Populus x berolinensis]|nr:hypothetical protein NC652_040381 [Populus alba x Populus x berolinensis]
MGWFVTSRIASLALQAIHRQPYLPLTGVVSYSVVGSEPTSNLQREEEELLFLTPISMLRVLAERLDNKSCRREDLSCRQSCCKSSVGVASDR